MPFRFIQCLRGALGKREIVQYPFATLALVFSSSDFWYKHIDKKRSANKKYQGFICAFYDHEKLCIQTFQMCVINKIGYIRDGVIDCVMFLLLKALFNHGIERNKLHLNSSILRGPDTRNSSGSTMPRQ